MSGWSFWIDRGGTFTDVVARRPDGVLEARKFLSHNPRAYPDAVTHGIRDFLGLPPQASLPSGQIAALRIGTTVATNALLQRRGAAVGLAITRGFADALWIGDQRRPELFRRDIRRPEPLYRQVVEICERVAADGERVEALDEEDARQKLQDLRGAGIEALAIVLMHGFRYPAHEQRLAEIAREVGFEQVFASHRNAALIRLVRRGDTTVADAYLTPVLQGWRESIERCFDAPLAPGQLLFMNSSGGLVDARDFSGRNAVLSGPAGGVVAAAELCRQEGWERCIAFDMGGTSTDVSLYEGSYERSLDTRVAGVHFAVPMMRIHTVAAGGSSVLHAEPERLRVGPDSAGADPGPLCYRQGGPLCLSDAQLLLGVLRPEYFPAIFGSDGRQSLDREAVQQAFAEWAAARSLGAEQLAEDFVEVAVAGMVRAVRRITVERGLEPGEYALCSFGSASGQYVCRIAEALGIREVLYHPLAGALSAWGIGMAQLRGGRELSVEQALDGPELAAVEERARKLLREIEQELRARHRELGPTVPEVRLQLKYRGTDAGIEIPWELADAHEALPETSESLQHRVAELRRRFEEIHLRRFSFLSPETEIRIATLLVELCAEKDAAATDGSRLVQKNEPQVAPGTELKIFIDGSWHPVPVLNRSILEEQRSIQGPALLVEELSTLLLRPGWNMQLQAQGVLRLQHQADAMPAPRAISIRRADPARLEIFHHRFMSIAEQMGLTLQNSARSLNIRERTDFSCAVFDARGRLIANAPHIPVHLGSMGDSVRAMIRKYKDDLRPGDAWVLNDPFLGGTHLPDLTVISPVFPTAAQGPQFFTATRGHHADVGGLSPGSMPADSSSIEEEGVLFDGLRLVREGNFAEAELYARLGAGAYPARNPEQNVADLRAQLEACRLGERQLLQLAEECGLRVLKAYMKHLRSGAAQAVRRVLRELSDGEFSVEMDNGARVSVAVRIDRRAQRAELDFSGSSRQGANNFNAPAAVCRAAVLYVFRTLVEEEIPLNDGCLEPLRLKISRGSLLNPRPPAAVVAGNVETSQIVVDALFGALGLAAASQGTMNNFSCGDARYQYYETLGGGAGAGPGFDGASAVHTHMTNSRLTDPEVLEDALPLRVEACAVRRGSGGAGHWKGGEGMHRSLLFLAPMQVSLLGNRRRTRPFGLQGGAPGAAGCNLLQQADGQQQELPAASRIEVQAGDRISILTPGGGGFGTAKIAGD